MRMKNSPDMSCPDLTVVVGAVQTSQPSLRKRRQTSIAQRRRGSASVAAQIFYPSAPEVVRYDVITGWLIFRLHRHSYPLEQISSA